VKHYTLIAQVLVKIIFITSCLNQENIVMLVVVHPFSFIAFYDALN